VPIVSFVLSFIGKKLTTILQALFGWSVTALFGRLPKKKQIAVTVALVLSICWPIFVVGVFVPNVAAWVLAFVPLEKWLGATFLRILWGALAITAPLGVGALVRFAAPMPRVSYPKALLHGYPLALGFFVAFVITVVTVPAVKVASIFRGWSDSHVYVQPRKGRYKHALEELTEACARAGILPEVTDLPTSMALSTKVLKVLARGTVQPIVAEEIRLIKADGLEIYLYPSDLLLRGEPKKVAKVRAMMTRTQLDADAYLVASEDGQAIQDELGRLTEVLVAHAESGRTTGDMISSRLVEVWAEMTRAQVDYDEWVMLEAIARRVERRIVRQHHGKDILPLERAPDGLEGLVAKQNEQAERRDEKENIMATEPLLPGRDPLEEAPTADLVKETFADAKELVRLEVELAKNEVKEEVKQLEHSAIAFGVSLVAALLFLSMMAVAIVLALGGTPLAAIGVGIAFAVIAGITGYLGYAKLPKNPLDKTRRRLASDVHQLKEHVA
jgi:uncharacterized membrane protein YqjE